MRYGIDLDGVLVDMHLGLAKVINSIWPGRIPPGAEYPPDWDLMSLGLFNSELDKVWDNIGERWNWWMSLPAFTNNVGAVYKHRITHPDDEVFYVTARCTDTKGLPLMHQSQRWLDQSGIGGVGTAVLVLPEGTKKIDVYEELAVDYAVDDSLKVVDEGFHIIYLLDRPWNQINRSKGLDVVSDLDEFFEITRRGK